CSRTPCAPAKCRSSTTSPPTAASPSTPCAPRATAAAWWSRSSRARAPSPSKTKSSARPRPTKTCSAPRSCSSRAAAVPPPLIARLDDDGKFFVAVHVLDEGEPVSSPPIPVDDTIMGLCLSERTPVQRVRPPSGHGDVSIDPFTGTPVQLLPYEEDLFEQGVG